MRSAANNETTESERGLVLNSNPQRRGGKQTFPGRNYKCIKPKSIQNQIFEKHYQSTCLNFHDNFLIYL